MSVFLRLLLCACGFVCSYLMHPQITEMEAIMSARNEETKEIKVMNGNEGPVKEATNILGI